MSLRFRDDVLEPEPTMGKRLFNKWFPWAFWLGVFSTLVYLGYVAVTGDVSDMFYHISTIWFYWLTMGLFFLMYEGWKEKRYVARHKA